MAIWLALLALLILYVLLKWPSRAVDPTTHSRFSRSDLVALAALAVLFAACAFVMLYRVDLADHDHSQLTRPIVGHRPLQPPIWPSSGRFFPLGNQEFELVRMLGAPGIGYFILPTLELAALCVLLLRLLNRFPTPARVGAVAFVLIAPSTQLIFTGLIYSERNILLFLVLMALGLQRHDRLPSRGTALLTLAAVHFALYYKETVFVLVAAIAATRMFIDWTASGRRSGIREFLATHPLEVGMLGLALAFVALYALTMLPYRSMEYAQNYSHRGTALTTLVRYLRTDPILIVFLTTATVRGIAIWRRRVIPDPLWDPLAVGAVGYFSAYIALGMWSAYYMAPVDLLGILYVTVVACEAVSARRIRAVVPATVAAALGVLLLLSSWYMLVWRKNVVASTAALAEFVKGTADTSDAPVRVFLPQQTNYAVMEFGSLLEYKGARVRADSIARAGEVILYAAQETRDGKCVESSRVPCTQAATAPAGSVVLIMATANPPPGSLQSLRPGHPAVAIRPFGIPPFLPALRAVRRLLDGEEIPPRQDWLWAYGEIAREHGDQP